MSNNDIIENALSALLSRSNGDAFVIFEETKTKKFVQFAGAQGKIFLNLPSNPLSAPEMEKAKTLFKEYGVEAKTFPISSVKVWLGKKTDFDMDLGQNTKKAALIAMRVFKEVYGFSDNFILKVEEN